MCARPPSPPPRFQAAAGRGSHWNSKGLKPKAGAQEDVGEVGMEAVSAVWSLHLEFDGKIGGELLFQGEKRLQSSALAGKGCCIWELSQAWLDSMLAPTGSLPAAQRGSNSVHRPVWCLVL